MEAAWGAVPAELAAERPAAPDAWESYCDLWSVLSKMFTVQLEENEPGLYDEFS